MTRFKKLALGAAAAAGLALCAATPAAARTSIGISFGFGWPGYADFGPCDYYDYYYAPPPWGLPPDYCDYDIYYEPVFWGGEWYRGPIYYRWNHGHRVYWLNGGWRDDEWRGRRPSHIEWRDRGRNSYRANWGGHVRSYNHYDSGRSYDRHDGDHRSNYQFSGYSHDGSRYGHHDGDHRRDYRSGNYSHDGGRHDHHDGGYHGHH